MTSKETKLCLVCSSGGHFLELFLLNRSWRQYPHFWVTFDSEDTCSLLEEDKAYWAFSPTNRNIFNFIKNLWLARRILSHERPDFIVSTGAGIAVPFAIIGKLFRIKVIYIESLARVENLSLSGKIIYFFADEFIVRWPQLALRFKKAKYVGALS